MHLKKQANIITNLLNLLAKDSEKVKCQDTTLLFFFKRDRAPDLFFITIRQLNFAT